jgi:hypothetical protein
MARQTRNCEVPEGGRSDFDLLGFDGIQKGYWRSVTSSRYTVRAEVAYEVELE